MTRLTDLEEKYDLEITRIAAAIKKEKARKVLLQFPDGLKPYATEIADELKVRSPKNTEILLWLDTCFGACDIPLEVERLGVDLIVQFGHSNWSFNNKKGIKVLK